MVTIFDSSVIPFCMNKKEPKNHRLEISSPVPTAVRDKRNPDIPAGKDRQWEYLGFYGEFFGVCSLGPTTVGVFLIEKMNTHLVGYKLLSYDRFQVGCHKLSNTRLLEKLTNTSHLNCQYNLCKILAGNDLASL